MLRGAGGCESQEHDVPRHVGDEHVTEFAGLQVTDFSPGESLPAVGSTAWRLWIDDFVEEFTPFQELFAWRLPNTREFGGATSQDCNGHHGDDDHGRHGDRLRAIAARAPVYRPSTRYWPNAWKRRGALDAMVISERGR